MIRVFQRLIGRNPSASEIDAAKGKVLLAVRGQCTFYERANRSFAAGARGLIIGDSNAHSMQFDAKFLSPFIAKGSPGWLPIPVIFVLGSTYSLMMRDDTRMPVQPAWQSTRVDINAEGLVFDMDDFCQSTQRELQTSA